ncbi:MAG: hypothetical protein ACK5NB_08080 [Flavobacteriaceae bacterium]
MDNLNTLSEKINQNKTLDFGNILSQSIELFKKVWTQGMLLILLSIAIIIPLYLLIYIPIVFFGIMSPAALGPESISENEAVAMGIGLIIITCILGLAIVFCFMVVIFGLQTAFYRICKIKDLNEIGSDDFFHFLKKDHLKKTIALSLYSFGIYLLATMLCYLPVFYVMVPMSFVSVIHAFNPNLSTSDIINLSFKIGNKYWLITFGLMFVAGLMAELGLFLCIIGIIATAAFALLPQYFIYKDVIGFEENNDEIEKIGLTED